MHWCGKKLKHQRLHPGFGADSLTLKGGIWLGLDDAEILIPDGSGVMHYVYKMEDETADLARRAYDIAKKKYEQRKKRRAAFKGSINWNAVFASGALVVIVGFVWFILFRTEKSAHKAAVRNKEIKTQVDEYAASLPNYDDSIRLARTDEELQRALNRREQAQLKIAHFADSLRAQRR